MINIIYRLRSRTYYNNSQIIYLIFLLWITCAELATWTLLNKILPPESWQWKLGSSPLLISLLIFSRFIEVTCSTNFFWLLCKGLKTILLLVILKGDYARMRASDFKHLPALNHSIFWWIYKVLTRLNIVISA